ncbi:MAG TPA: hypothetical protein PK297_08435 [Spirochaetota bacterium]|nr:hypothetical protein [Spirochaetota bacterium]
MSEDQVACGYCGTDSRAGQHLCPVCGVALPLVDGGTDWERRRELGLASAFVRTVGGVFRSPSTVFASLRGGVSHLGAVLLAVILGFFSSLIQAIWTMALVPGETKAAFAELLKNFTVEPIPQAALDDIFRVIMLGQVALSPIFSILALYLEAGLIWLALSIARVQGLRFSMVLLLVALSEISGLAVVIPQIGGMLAMVLGVVFLTTGLGVRFRLTTGKALACALAPPVVLMLFFVLGTGALSAIG